MEGKMAKQKKIWSPRTKSPIVNLSIEEVNQKNGKKFLKIYAWFPNKAVWNRIVTIADASLGTTLITK
jgi:hypothetical protein